jgi:hypothetical protein
LRGRPPKNWRIRGERWFENRISDGIELAYCNSKETCHGQYKEVRKATSKKGLYYVFCRSPDGCNLKTFYPVKVDLTKGEHLSK